MVLRRRRRWGRTDGRTYGGCAIRGVRVRSGGARSSARERFGTVSPAMEKRVELEKRGRNPGEVRQTFDYYFIFASGLSLPPIFISLFSLSPHRLSPLSRCCASSLPMCISLVYTLSLSLVLSLCAIRTRSFITCTGRPTHLRGARARARVACLCHATMCVVVVVIVVVIAIASPRCPRRCCVALLSFVTVWVHSLLGLARPPHDRVKQSAAFAEGEGETA